MYDVLNKKYQSHIKSRNMKSPELFFLQTFCQLFKYMNYILDFNLALLFKNNSKISKLFLTLSELYMFL